MQRIKDLILSRLRVSRTSSGFTLIELLVVIAVIGILVSIISFSFTTAQKQSRDSRRRQDVQQIQNGLEQYYAENTTYPIGAEIDTAFDGSRPKDPKNSGAYTYLWDTAVDQYCICAVFETSSGNSNPPPGGATCNFSDGGTYYCAQNQQ